jgi:hypothetical protein
MSDLRGNAAAAWPREADAGRGGTRLALALTLLVAAAPVRAVQSDYDWEYSSKQIRPLIQGYADCVVKRQPAKASEAVLSTVDNDALLKNYQMLIIGDCLVQQTHASSQMRFKGDLYRYALAEALFKRELAAQPAPDLSAAPKLEHPDPGPEPQPIDAKGRKLSKRKYEEALQQYRQQVTFAFLASYGECVVRQAPAQARALLLTKPDSSEETGRFGQLHPVLAACMPEGHTISFGRVALRGSIAINYYRLAHGARAAATGAAE